MIEEYLEYNPETGMLRWKIKPSKNIAAGIEAGCINNEGYRVIRFKRKLYLAHHLAWYFIFGCLPKTQLDHKDGNKLNNSKENLREATYSENKINVPAQINNTSGYKGVIKYKNKWVAQISKDKVHYYLGIFNSPEEAFEAYKRKALILHGEFIHVSISS